MEIGLALLVGSVVGFGFGLYLGARWAGEAVGRSLKREMRDGRMVDGDVNRLIEGMKRK